MNYVSSRGNQQQCQAADAIKQGMAVDGGLYVPTTIPQIDRPFLKSLLTMNYQHRAYAVLSRYLTDYTETELRACIAAAYGEDAFDCRDIAPLVTVGDKDCVLELWHGPTSAFKDMALQLLPQLLSKALLKTGEKNEIVILVATSGDTGKAALEGFKDVPRIRIVVFYPQQGVSEMQRLQMVSQEGNNVAVMAIQGNFDDAQTGVKQIFHDPAFNAQLLDQGFRLSSANSINWGRLAPQIVYYFSAYADMVNNGTIANGEAVNFVVPTGNFGNILAGYYAKEMGLPVQRLLCASNSNNVLTDFLRTGVYDRNRAFHKTLSPSMDILISSNLERLLYHTTGGDAKQVAQWMAELNASGVYRVDGAVLERIRSFFWADWADDSATKVMIRQVFAEHRYLLDTHTAVAWQVCENYRRQTGDQTPTVIVSTASPFKFNASVLQAIGKAASGLSEFAMLQELSQGSGWPIPAGLAALQDTPVLHTGVCAKEAMPAAIADILQIK